MDTLKTGFVVVLLLAVLYGVYVVLNKDNSPPTAEIAWHQQEAEKDLQIDISAPGSPASPAAALGGSGAGDSTKTGSSLGIPSVLKAELTPTETETKATGETKLASEAKLVTPPKSALPSLPAASRSTYEPVEPPAVPLKPSTTVPEPATPVSSPTVPAPSLLPSAPPAETPKDLAPAAPAVTTADASPAAPSTELNPLPALRGEADPSGSPAMPALTATTEPGSTEPVTTSPVATSTPPTSTPEVPSPAGPATTPSSTVGIAETTPPSTPEKPDPSDAANEITTAAAYAAALQEAHANIAGEKWYAALFLMSKFYDSPDLSREQQQELVDLLDPLAAKVIYSSEHLVADAYEVQRGESLTQIAESFQVPLDLLANINGVQNPDVLVPGTKLKVVRGPFRADVNLTRQELTLFAGQLYAGRFPISVGRDPQPQEGQFRVLEKQPGRVYYAGAGQTISASDPQNPYGSVWIGLEKELAIHGSPEQGESAAAGCISLSPVDARDVYGILTLGSSVTIRR